MRVPEIGQFVLVRRRPGIVKHRAEFSDEHSNQILHMVDVEYIDGYDHPQEDRIVWEREIDMVPYSVLDFPGINQATNQPDRPERYHAFIDAVKWTSHGMIQIDEKKIVLPSSSLLSPWFSAVQVEDYQLYPVLEALSLPRVNLLLADDVGLGKTIEAGLIVQELIRQRRIRRILIVCPSSLQIQWQDEMKEKFNLDFTIINSEQVFGIQRDLGMDANPWTVSPKIITSMDYLKQTDILNRFKSGTEHLLPHDAIMLPWDLLIVDEAHNFSPARLSDDSNRYRLLRDITPYFEHRLFLTATPHNGYTASFSGLLELLDPVRFQQKPELTDDDFKHLRVIMIRRMKSELNEGHDPPRFPLRNVNGLTIELSDKETALYGAMRTYRIEARKELAKIGNKERILGEFIFALLTKRLLSSSYAFAKTWWNHASGFGLEEFGYDQARQSRDRAETPVDDDAEKDRREEDAVRHGAGWLTQYRDILKPYIDEVSSILRNIGWTPEIVRNGLSTNSTLPQDKKWDRLLEWVKKNLQLEGKFHNEERLIIFTEYKDTLEYLLHRFSFDGIEDPEIQILFGGATSKHRRLIKEQFNEPLSNLRILLATDAASEGLNLQTSCRFVIHQEIPWNPMRLEQRNGRVDRHGQTRDVTAYHFVSNQIEDYKFLAFVANKVNTVRGDLGSTGKVLDEAVMEYFSTGRLPNEEIDRRIQITEEHAQDRKDLQARNKGSGTEYKSAMEKYNATCESLGITEARMARLLNEATKIENGELRCENEEKLLYRYHKIPPKWENLINRTLTISDEKTKRAFPKLVFSPERLIENVGGRELFKPHKDTKLLMLGHPVMDKALVTFRNRLWDQSGESNINRWTLEFQSLPDGISSVYNFTFQVTLRNELGERFKVGFLEVPICVKGDSVLALSHSEWSKITENSSTPYEFDGNITGIREQWLEVKAYAEKQRDTLVNNIQAHAKKELQKELAHENDTQTRMFIERMKALEIEKDSRTIDRLKKELIKAEEKAVQLTFSEDINRIHREQLDELKSKKLDAEWERQHGHVELLKRRLEKERKRILEKVLPKRYSLDPDGIDVLAVGVQILTSKEVGSE